MCGIFGYIGDIKEKDWSEAHALLTNLFIRSNSRGTHASGFSAIHCLDSPKLITEKRPIASDKFVGRSTKFNAFKRYMPKIFIGHTRFSTSGDPQINRNNHPFNSQRYSMVHNGTISDWEKSADELGIVDKMRSLTDSEMLIHLLEDKNVTSDAFQHMVDSVPNSSRIALGVMSHGVEHDRRLFLFRNDGSPISLLAIPKWRTILFASTDKIIEDALKDTYGGEANASERAKDYGCSLFDFPAWRLSEFGLDGNTPVAMEHFDINKPVMGFSQNPNGSSSSKSTYNVWTPVKPKPKDCDTLGNLKKCSESTQRAVSDITLTIDETLPVLQSLRTKPFMAEHEMEHWKRWMTRVY